MPPRAALPTAFELLLCHTDITRVEQLHLADSEESAAFLPRIPFVSGAAVLPCWLGHVSRWALPGLYCRMQGVFAVLPVCSQIEHHNIATCWDTLSSHADAQPAHSDELQGVIGVLKVVRVVSVCAREARVWHNHRLQVQVEISQDDFDDVRGQIVCPAGAGARQPTM